MKKILILILLMFIPLVMADDVIRPIPKQEGMFQKAISFVTKNWIIFVIIIVGAVVVIFIIMLIKRLKKKIDPFLESYNKVKRLTKFHRDPTIKEVWLISDTGLKYLGKYLGSATTNDGYFNILLWRFKKWYFFWFIFMKLDFFDLVKEDFIVRCNLNKTYKYVEKKGDKEEVKEIELTHDMVIKSEDKILIKALGIERVRYFFYPILRDKNENVIDNKIEIFGRERDSAMISVLYTQAEDFANISREIANMNPQIRFFTKLPDKSPHSGTQQ